MKILFFDFKLFFRKFNSYDLQDGEGELRKIIPQKYIFNNTFSRSGTTQQVKNAAIWYKSNSFCTVLIRIQKSDFIKRPKKILLGLILLVVLHPRGTTFLSIQLTDTK